jgi:hypothetical protein
MIFMENNERKQDSVDTSSPESKGNDVRLFAVIVILLLIVASVAFIMFGLMPPSENNGNDNEFIPYGPYKFRGSNDLYSLEYQWGDVVYNINFKYHPNNVTDIPVRGPWIDLDRQVYLAFDPHMSEKSLAYTQAAMLDMIQKLTLLFGRTAQVVCTDDSHPDCEGLPVVTCETHDSAIVFYESDEPRIALKGGCYEIHGFEEDIFRAEHKLVYIMLNIIRE